VNGGTQAQSIAYSLDEGTTWTTYDAANPVIALPPAPYQDQWRDFRDPFVFWHAASSKWVSIISLAQLHKILVYTSPNLKDWTHISEYGPVSGVNGVLECPSLFQLPLDGNEANLKWVLQIGVNPGGPPGTTGSGNLYQLGTFDGTTFTPDLGVTPSSPTSTSTAPPIATTRPASGNITFETFEYTDTYVSHGWTATGDLVGAGPAQGTLSGQQTVTGYSGNFVNTFINGDTTTGTLTSPSFTITQKQISFLIGGGNLPGQECINLKVQGQVVRTATGANEEKLIPQNWDVSDLIGQSAVIEIVDSSTSGWGHILIDEITFSNASPDVSLSRWVDFGPDFYAAVPFNGLQATRKVGIAWMSNWQYASSTPTSLWRGGLTIPRKLSLKTIDDRATLVQQPVADWTSLETVSDYRRSWGTVAEGTRALPLSGKALDITITFSDRFSASSSSQFGLILRATSDLGQQTRVGYDFGTKRLFVDRTKSGNVGFDSTFSNVYYAPLAPARNGQVTLRILLDWSSVEVFGGEGEATLTTQIFPNDDGVDMWLFSTGGRTNKVTINAKSVGSIYNTSPNPSSRTSFSTSSGFVTSIISSNPHAPTQVPDRL
jgi:beta-fructofuranosidase/levanase